MLPTVPRAQNLTVDAFRRLYVERSQPVIITDLRLGPALDDVRTAADLERRFGGVKVEVHPEYYTHLLRSGEFHTPQKLDKWWTIRRYLAHVQARPSTSLVCTEQPLPEALQADIRIPRYCRHRYSARDGVDSRVFMANRGNCAHLHFDTDFKQVLLHSLVGRRQIVLLPPRAVRALSPISNVSTLRLEDMTARERSAFARARGGVAFTLQPGETIYMPPRVWHFVSYLDHGLSINFRWGRSPVDAMMLRFPKGTDLQAVSSFVYEQGGSSPVARSILRELRRVDATHKRTERAFLHRQNVLRWIGDAIGRDGGLPTDLSLRQLIAAQEGVVAEGARAERLRAGGAASLPGL